MVIGVECMFSWYWLADLCAQEKIPFVLGHALYMKAVHGGKAQNDRLDAQKIAAILRGGMFPMAYVYPAKMRATRDLLRRRTFLVRQRAELLAHVQNTNIQYNFPPIGKKIGYESNREGVAERFADPSASKSVGTDLELITFYESVLSKLERDIKTSAKEHDQQALTLLLSVYGIGPILSLVILYEIHDVNRFPRVQNLLSYCRLVKCRKESVGKSKGGGGGKIGNAHLKWAFSEVAVRFVSRNPKAEKFFQRLVRKHGKGKALSVLATKLARAVYYVLKRERIFDMKKFLTA
jgi:transposase